ncbi:MAG TPA: hypothetical protein VEZ20_01920 [Allosphingosinicella sp.]|nr:hypothetical protein [Allosphingosinicella sp.]
MGGLLLAGAALLFAASEEPPPRGFCAGPVFVALAAGESVSEEHLLEYRVYAFSNPRDRRIRIDVVVYGPIDQGADAVVTPGFEHQGRQFETIRRGRSVGYRTRTAAGEFVSFHSTGFNGSDRDLSFFERVTLEPASESRCPDPPPPGLPPKPAPGAPKV